MTKISMGIDISNNFIQKFLMKENYIFVYRDGRQENH